MSRKKTEEFSSKTMAQHSDWLNHKIMIEPPRWVLFACAAAIVVYPAMVAYFFASSMSAEPRHTAESASYKASAVVNALRPAGTGQLFLTAFFSGDTAQVQKMMPNKKIRTELPAVADFEAKDLQHTKISDHRTVFMPASNLHPRVALAGVPVSSPDGTKLYPYEVTMLVAPGAEDVLTRMVYLRMWTPPRLSHTVVIVDPPQMSHEVSGDVKNVERKGKNLKKTSPLYTTVDSFITAYLTGKDFHPFLLGSSKIDPLDNPYSGVYVSHMEVTHTSHDVSVVKVYAIVEFEPGSSAPQYMTLSYKISAVSNNLGNWAVKKITA